MCGGDLILSYGDARMLEEELYEKDQTRREIHQCQKEENKENGDTWSHRNASHTLERNMRIA